MYGDSLYNIFFWHMFKLVLSVCIIAIADNTILFLSAWFYCNWVLTKLMIHKATWKAAQASGKLVLHNSILGSISIASAFGIFYILTKSLSIQYIVTHTKHSWLSLIALTFLLIGVMRQSAIWPFHRWLISSLNSPTPVSALMHAGIINAGGLLLIRFAPLYLQDQIILNTIFIIGLISALIGCLWKLMQHDIKRTLACSTMEQMGFMLIQCGLGLFGSALAHLYCHGLFKAYLFLNCSNSTQEKKINTNQQFHLPSFLLAVTCGIFSSYIFATMHHISLSSLDAKIIILTIVAIANSQLALIILGQESIKNLPLAIITTATITTLYGTIVYICDLIIKPLDLMQSQPLNNIHIIGLIILTFAWLFMLHLKYYNNVTKHNVSNLLLYWYVKTLNYSQPDPKTITPCRKGYDYV